MAGAVRIVGLADLFAALAAIDRELPLALKAELKEAASVVSGSAGDKLRALQPSPAKSAGGIIPRVRSGYVVTVEQKYRKTTGKRPDFGATQMQYAFLPAADENEAKVDEMILAAVEKVSAGQGF